MDETAVGRNVAAGQDRGHLCLRPPGVEPGGGRGGGRGGWGGDILV